MKKTKSISNKISASFSIITLIVGIIFYFLLPNLLNYPPDTINTEFDKKVSKLYYIYQYLIALTSIILLAILYFKLSLKKLDTWVKNKEHSKIPEIRKTCFTYPFKLFIIIEIVPIAIVILTLMFTGSHPAILIFKIGTLVFSFATLVSSIFLIISKNIFSPILAETSIYIKKEKNINPDSLVNRLLLQIFPSILVTALLISLIGYSRLVVEKGNLLNTYYMSQVKSIVLSDTEELLPQVTSQLNEKLLSDNDFIFIEDPNGDIITSNNDVLSDFFLKYMHTLSSSKENRVYEAYTIDEQGVINKVFYQGQEYTIGIHYEIVSSSLGLYFFLSCGILFVFNLIILMYVAKSINDDLFEITKGMQTILVNQDNIEGEKLPITSNDIVGELVQSFNDIQDLTKKNIEKIHNNQDQLVEQERLASLGQMIGGIAHNLKTPIMSISGATQGLNDLIDEFNNSIGNPVVNNDDFHDIAKDMYEWTTKIKSYTEYMSDVITAVKGQAVNFSNETDISFSLMELFKRVDILMKHELKNSLVYLNTSMKVDENTILHGDVNILVQVINNMISNAIQAYNGEPEKNIDLIASSDGDNIIITVRDYGPGLPKKVKEKLFKEMITTKGKNGTGLGLYMSYSTIKARFNGNIVFESEDGVGTSFYIILPR